MATAQEITTVTKCTVPLGTPRDKQAGSNVARYLRWQDLSVGTWHVHPHADQAAGTQRGRKPGP